MQENLATLIRNTAARVRMRDFAWAAGISAIVGIAALFARPGDWRLMAVAWVTFVILLGVRYRLSSGRVWAAPVQRILETELSAQEAELANLRMAGDVAEALPGSLVHS